MASSTEHADVTDNAIDTITCICGNSCSDEGMPQCNEDGIVFHLSVVDVDEGPVAESIRIHDELEG